MKPLRLGNLNFGPAVLNSDLPFLVAFGGSWERSSRNMFALLNGVGKKYDKKIKVGYVDYDYAPDVFDGYAIKVLPTLIFFEDGKPIIRHEGYQGTETAMDFVKRFYGVLPEFHMF